MQPLFLPHPPKRPFFKVGGACFSLLSLPPANTWTPSVQLTTHVYRCQNKSVQLITIIYLGAAPVQQLTCPTISGNTVYVVVDHPRLFKEGVCVCSIPRQGHVPHAEDLCVCDCI